MKLIVTLGEGSLPPRSASTITAWNVSPCSHPVTNARTGMLAALFISTTVAIFTGTGERGKVSHSPILWMRKVRPKQAKGLAGDYRASGLPSGD